MITFQGELLMSKSSKKRAERAQARAQTQKRRTIFLAVGGVAVAATAILLVVFLAGGGGKEAPVDEAAAQGDQNKEISVAEVAAKGDQGAFILDVRTPEEWEEYHIADSTLIPLDELEARVDEVPRDQEVVVVCRSGNRSQQGRDILLNAGFTDVSSMKGGLVDWQAQSYPVVVGP
jgi:phage shock protein E